METMNTKKTNYFDDYDRLAENLDRNYQIFSEEDFNNAYDDYLKDEEIGKRNNFRKKALDHFLTNRNILPSKRQMVKMSITAPKRERRYKQRYKEFKPKHKVRYSYSYAGKIKNKTVMLRRITVLYKTKKGNIKGVAYIDSKGRRGSIKTKRVYHSKKAKRKRHNTKP